MRNIKMIRRGLCRLATRQIQAIISSAETIKPSTPTPAHLKRYNLSIMDQLNPRIYMPVILFYPNNDCDDNPNKTADKTRRIKQALSETLTHYYPFTGRLKSESHVDCSDDGVEYEDANLECKLSDVVGKPNQALGLLLRDDLAWSYLNYDSSLVIVRNNIFTCGGMAITVCFSHKVADACTVCHFLIYWAAVSRQLGEQVSPYFVSSPPNDSVTLPEYSHEKQKYWVTKRFVFNNSKIADLKTMVAKNGVCNPTRVNVVTSLLYRCAMTSAQESSSGLFNPSYLVHMVNMRSRLVPPLPETYAGNLYWRIIVPSRDESEAKLSVLSDQIKKGMIQVMGLKSLNEIEDLSDPQEFLNYRVYLCSSVCGFPFHKVDFGWGKPFRLSFGGTSLNNMFLLMDTPAGDGIEATVSLTDQDMTAFQANKELLTFSSLQ